MQFFILRTARNFNYIAYNGFMKIHKAIIPVSKIFDNDAIAKVVKRSITRQKDFAEELALVRQTLQNNTIEVLDISNADDKTIKSALHLAVQYSAEIGKNAELRQFIINKGGAEFAYLYCRDVEVDAEMRQMVLNHAGGGWALAYIKSVDENDAEMRQAIINGKRPSVAYLYCRDVSNDDDMRQIVLSDKKFAAMYCRDVADDVDMRKVAEA